MKKFTLFAVAMLFSAVSFAALNPFAYALSSHLSPDQKTLTVNYSLNADATSVKIIIGEDAKEVECTGSNLTKGSHAVEISTEGIPTASPQSWRVVVEGKSVATPTEHSVNYDLFHPSSVDIDNNPENPTFGLILTNEGMQSVKGKVQSDTGEPYLSSDMGAGVYAFTPAFEPIKNGDKPGFNGGKTFSTATNMFAPRRIRFSKDGRIFATAQDGSGEYLWEINPENLNEWTTVFQGTNDGYTLKDAEGNFIAGTNSGFDVRGEGENLQLLMLSSSLPGAQVGSFKCHTYDLGTATTWATAPTKEILGANYMVVTNQSNAQFDKDGGVWYIQYRGTTTDAEPGLVHINKDGVEDLKVLRNYARNAGFRFTPDFSKVVIAGTTDGAANPKKATVYTVSADENGVPVLTEEVVIDMAVVGNNLNDFAWDYAGNLYACGNSSEKLVAWAMPYGGTVTTPCAAKYQFTLQEGGVEGTFYDVTVNCEAEQGQVTGNDGTYLEGSTVTLTATANRGYKFLNWTVGETTYTENPLTLTVNSNLSVTANFEALTPLTVTAVANDEALGTVTGSGAYFEGENVTLTATPNAGCEFVKWSNEATDATITIPAQDITLTAIFQKISYTVTLLTNDAAKGTVTGTGSYTAGEEVSLSAVPAEGYKLLYWSDRVAEAERTITVSGNVALSAYFVKDYTSVSYTVEKVWENTNVPASTSYGYQAVGWDGKIYMQDAGNKKIVTYSSADDLGTDYATAGGAGQQIAVDEAGNLIVFNATFYSATPNAILIYQKGSTEGKAVSFTLPQPGRCDFFTASGDIYSAEGGYVYFYCQNKTVVNRLKIANGAATEADVTVDVVGQEITAGNSQNHVMVDIFGNLVAVSRSNAASWINVYTNESSKTFATTLSGIKLSTLGGCSFELGGKELWAYNVGSTAYNSEWNLYNLTDEEFLSETALYAKNTTDKNSAANWLNVQVVDEKTAYIYQFCPKVATAVWKVTCTAQEKDDTTTPIVDIQVAPQVKKVVRNGQVLIIRDGKTYNMMGQEIR